MRRLDDPGRLGGDERGEVELVEQRRLEQLGGGQRSLDDGDRGVGMDDAALGDGVDAQPAEVDVGEPRAEGVVEEPLAAPTAMAAQGVDVDGSGVDGGRPRGERPEAGGDAVAGLVVAVVRVGAEEVLEPDRALVQAVAEVQLGHRQLVGVGAEDAAPQRRTRGHRRRLRPARRSRRRYRDAVAVHYDTRTALVVVDVQNDFADPAGSLSVPGATDVIDTVNEHIAAATERRCRRRVHPGLASTAHPALRHRRRAVAGALRPRDVGRRRCTRRSTSSPATPC